MGGDERGEGGAAARREGSLKFITCVAAFLPVSFSLTSCQLTQPKFLKLVNIYTNLCALRKWLQNPSMRLDTAKRNMHLRRGVGNLIFLHFCLLSGWFRSSASTRSTPPKMKEKGEIEADQERSLEKNEHAAIKRQKRRGETERWPSLKKRMVEKKSK